MRPLTTRQIALIAGAVAVVVYLPALANGWALDDVGVIERNARAHHIGAALRGFFAPYWPVADNRSAGLFRPLVILSYSVDWVLAGGQPWLAHFGNVMWHALATGLLVLVAAAWLTGPALLVAGLVFALHPVHIEAVANVVGRAELLAAVCVLAAILAARRHRRTAGRARGRWAAATIAAVVAGLLVKEHAIVAIPLIGLDGMLTRGRDRADRGVYVGLVAVVLGWLHIWRAVAGGFVLETVAAPFRDVGALERVNIMLPVLFDVLRLLVWPFDLAADYSPQLVTPHTNWSAIGVLGAVLAVAVLLLGLLSVRRAPPVAFGVFAAALAWGPTANFLVPSGIVLSERTLYLPSIGVALVAGWLAAQLPRLAPDRRRAILGAAGLCAVAWVARIETRIPFWHDTRSVVIGDYLQHPQNYRAHARVGSVYELTGDTASALREFLTAAEIWPGDYVLTLQTARAARAVGNVSVALRESRRGLDMAPRDPVLAERMAAMLAWAGRPEDALAVVADGIAHNPGVVLLEERYLAVLQQMEVPQWWRGLVEARIAWESGRPAAAGDALADAALAVPVRPPAEACRDLEQGAELARNLQLGDADHLKSVARVACSGD